jgi:hypothetical protein
VKPESIYEVCFIGEEPPKRRVSISGHLHALYAATFPHCFIPAGQYCIPGPPSEVNAALEEQKRKVAAIRAGRSKGGRAPKHLPGLQATVDRLAAEHPDATAQELWDLIPAADDDDPVDGFIVYRDGSKVVQVNDTTGGEKAISFRSFCRYVSRARSK